MGTLMYKTSYKTYLIYILLLPIFTYSSETKGSEKNQKTLHFLTTDYCPLMCQNQKEQGIMVEILKAIYVPLGYKIHISYKPIKRAFNDATEEIYDGFIGGDMQQLGKNLFPKYVTVPNPSFIYKRAKDKWSYKGVDSLKNKILVTTKGFHYANSKLNTYISKTEGKNTLQVDNGDHIPKMIKLLEKNRADLFIAGELKVQAYLRKNKKGIQIKPERKAVGIFKNFISINQFSPKSGELLRILDTQFIKLFKSGQLQKIYKKYGITRKIKLLKK